MIVDNGTRREFESGAVRDIAEGKGRCDLLPLDQVQDILYLQSNILNNINSYLRTGSEAYIISCITDFSAQVFDSRYTAVLEVSKHFEEGCNKYGERNWEKGIPLHCYIDSAIRHYLKYLRGDQDERHDRAFLWNLLCLLWTQKNKPELNDLPFANKIEN